jgi:hypothetical protein
VATDELPVARSDEPILAWRAWALTIHGRDLSLKPVAGRGRAWPAGKPMRSRCRHSRLHPSPDPDCSCGLHGTHGLDILRKTRTPGVLGRVALWGTVIEHELGFRASLGYPQRLRLVCQFCFQVWGAEHAQPAVVGRFPHGELVPLCRPHLELARRYRMTPRGLLPAVEVEQRLLDTYMVELLPVPIRSVPAPPISTGLR